MASSQPPLENSEFSIVSVQELNKDPNITVPNSYFRPDQEPPKLLNGNHYFPAIPTIDLERLVSKEQAEFELAKLESTCKEWGIFQLVNHGVSSSLLEKLKFEIQEFFNLPLEEKMKYKIKPDDFEGKTLNTEIKEMEELFEDGMQSVRFNYYPPCSKPELVMGLAPHSDATVITILNQLNGVDGLHIKKDSVWIPVSILPEALAINLGDILEIMSNGLYQSVEHRASINSVKERISIAFFVGPKFDAEIGPARSLINPENPPLFKRIGTEEYFKSFFSRKLKGKTNLEYMKIEHGEGMHHNI
ncbi:hypothetical protein Patl1_10298 [Pistacia atlantica]|uniref:Uncharacterized protein n=1 Tax=Pistacia atlantica TaxID=434234 RepID=A0ACC1A6L0_9ROSI|nr:hypothetical protein Patl1_10298 [Pistacia atlantica]